VSPQIRLMIAIRLSWLCKLGFLGKRKSTYTCLGMGEEHTVKTKEREIRFLERLRAQFSKQIRVHSSQGSAIITVHIAEGKDSPYSEKIVCTTRGRHDFQGRSMYSSYCTSWHDSRDRFCAFIVVDCYLYSDTISQKSRCYLVGTCGQLKLVGTNF
jgi:hypothetical protein